MKLVLSALAYFTFAANAAPCDKYDSFLKTVCENPLAGECKTTDSKKIDQLVINLKELLAPNPKIVQAHKAFAAKEKATKADVETYFEALKLECPQQNLRMFRALINSSSSEKFAPLVKEAANRKFEAQPSLLSASIDVLITDAGQKQMNPKAGAQKEMDDLRAELKAARARLSSLGKDLDGIRLEEDPALAVKISKMESVESQKIRSRLQNWAAKYL